MKIESIKSASVYKSASPSDTERDAKEVILYSAHNDSSVSHTHILEKIITIQKIKDDLGIQGLAASDLDSSVPDTRRDAARRIGNRPTVWWSDFKALDTALREESSAWFGRARVVDAITHSMAEVLNKLYPSEIEINKYSDSNLMWVACQAYTAGIGANEIYSSSRENAARALRIIVEKIGEKLEDENAIIKSLLGSSLSSVRLQGALAAENSYKHSWRKNIQAIGLITAFRKEEDAAVRQGISHAIALASPKSIIESHAIDGSSEKFCFLSRLISDRSYGVRRNLLWGVTEVLNAQRQRGKYYETFKETPELTPSNRIDCFDYSLRIVEQLCSNNSPSKDELSMLHNSCYVIFYSLDDEAERSMRSAGQSYNYERLERRLSQIDIVRFIKLTTKPDVDSPELNTWNLAYQATDKTLYLKSKDLDKPLIYFFQLKTTVKQLRQSTTESKTITNLEDSLKRIDDTVANYISNTPYKQIKWGEYSEFNVTFAELLDLLKTTKKDSIKIAIISLFDVLNTQGLTLEDLGRVSLESALIEQNKLGMQEGLRSTIHSKPVTQNFFMNPPLNTPPGKAIQLYRKILRSFKDYFGMLDLKNKALELASNNIAQESPAQNSGRQIGFLLSGTPGTGKSLFAEVLANELALPLIVLETNKLKEDQSGNIIFEEGHTKLKLEQYLDNLLQKIKSAGACVILIDEMEKIASPEKLTSVVNLSQFLQKLKSGNYPVIVIATTNHPGADSIVGLSISNDGSSTQIDSVLSQNVSQNVFNDLQPCYLFHERSVGANFTREYLPALSKSGKIASPVDIPVASKLSRGLSPASIIFSFSKLPRLTQEIIVNQLKRLKAENDYYMGYLSRHLRTRIDDLLIEGAHTIEGELDYFELALAAEGTPINLIAETIKNTPSPLNQTVLMESLEKLQ